MTGSQLWSRFLTLAALLAVSSAFCPNGFSPSAWNNVGLSQNMCTRKAAQNLASFGSKLNRFSLQKRTALRSSESGSDDRPLTLSAYDQLVLSVRSLTVKEIQNELKTRAVSYDDCFEKEDLVARLTEARLQIAAEALGSGDISVDGAEVKVTESKDDPVAKAPEEPKAGGPENFGSAKAAQDFLKSMNPAKIQKLMADQELIAAVRNPTVMRMAQEVMQDPKSMAKYANDPDVLRAIKKIQDFMASN